MLIINKTTVIRYSITYTYVKYDLIIITCNNVFWQCLFEFVNVNCFIRISKGKWRGKQFHVISSSWHKKGLQNPWCILWDILCFRMVSFQQSSSFIPVVNSTRPEYNLRLCLTLKSEDGHRWLCEHLDYLNEILNIYYHNEGNVTDVAAST